MRSERGDVVFAPDPFKSSSDPRPWLILAARSMPFPGEFLCAALTTSEFAVNHEVKAGHWNEGGQFTERVVRDAIRYLGGPSEG